MSNDPADGFPIVVAPTRGEPVATSEVQIGVTLPISDAMLGAQDAVPPTAAFDPTDPTTFAFSNPMTILSKDGTPLNVKAYYIKTDSPDAADPSSTWEVKLSLDGNILASTSPVTVTFDMAGVVSAGGTGTFDIVGRPVSLDLTGSGLADRAFRVESAWHDGMNPASLYSMEVNASGTVFATYSNGDSVALAKIFLANFPNPQGLRQMGATALGATPQSGAPILGTPAETGFGLLRSGALERSNVELTQELVNLITAQRNYQASAKAMETSSSLSQTIINMR